MAALLNDVLSISHLDYPKWMKDNLLYVTFGGSHLYGTNNAESDIDIRGIVMPPKQYIYPEQYGYIHGFDEDIPKFDRYEKADIEHNKQKYDIGVYGLIRYFKLCLNGNPETLEILYANRECILHTTSIGELIRSSRSIFLHQDCLRRLRNYAFGQLHKAGSQERTGKRKAIVDELGFDPKFLSHVVRLTYQCEQLLQMGAMDLQANREHIKSVKRGEISLVEIKSWFTDKEKKLDKLLETTKLPCKPRKSEIKALLLECIKKHYANTTTTISSISEDAEFVKDIMRVVTNYKLTAS